MKKDKDLGLKVHNHLVGLGLETPMVFSSLNPQLQKEIISKNIEDCLITLGLDLSDDSLIDTPNRVAKMWVDELFSGLNYENFPKVTVIENKMGYDEMVLVKDISANSSCEHHIITIDQIVHIAYIPKNKVVGLSKFARIAKFFAQRPQVQERFTAQLFEALKFILETDDIAVSAQGVHYCMRSRGVEDGTSSTITNQFGGAFKTNVSTRNEFLNSIRK